MKKPSFFALAAAAMLLLLPALVPGALPAGPYPLDGYERTGIRRLRAYSMLLDGTMPGSYRMAPGARLAFDEVRLRLEGLNDSYDIGAGTPVDTALQRGLERIADARDPSYRFAVVDITDPANPRYAAVRPNHGYTPGSVGKLLVMTALFDPYPDTSVLPHITGTLVIFTPTIPLTTTQGYQVTMVSTGYHEEVDMQMDYIWTFGDQTRYIYLPLVMRNY